MSHRSDWINSSPGKLSSLSPSLCCRLHDEGCGGSGKAEILRNMRHPPGAHAGQDYAYTVPSMVCAVTDGLLGAGVGGDVIRSCCQWSDTLATSFAYMFRPLITILMKKYKVKQTCNSENSSYFTLY